MDSAINHPIWRMGNKLQQTSFLPDFCGTRIVFVVIILAELLAIILSLAQSVGTSDSLYDLAVYSLFIQWVALSCVAVLCLARKWLDRLDDLWLATASYLLTLLVSLVITEIAWLLFGKITVVHNSEKVRQNFAKLYIMDTSIFTLMC